MPYPMELPALPYHHAPSGVPDLQATLLAAGITMQSLSVEKLLRNFTFVQKHFASLEAMFLAIMSEVLYDLDVMRSDRPSQPVREADQRIRPQLDRLTDIVEQHKLTLVK